LRLAREQPQHIVVGYTMNHRAARQTVADIEALGVAASAISTEVGNSALLREMFEQVRQEHGRLDIFVSNAARTSFKSALETDERSWRRVMEINAQAFLIGAQLAAGIMRETGGGRIIGISSLGSRYAAPRYAALGAAKAVIETLTRYLAVELAPDHINVNVVCGGFVNTDSMRLAPDYETFTDYIIQRTPAGRLGQPEDLAGVVALLCSPDSDWIRGQTLIADGGFSLML
jgi:enoyl-[acyl-carrier protein] reductase III